MFVCSRGLNQSVVVGDATVTVIQIRGGKVRLGIVAPISVPIHSLEAFDAIHGRAAVPDAQAAQEEEITEMMIEEARRAPGRRIRFTSEGGIRQD